MAKRLLQSLTCLMVAFYCLSAQGGAQNANTSAREAEWRNYKVPASDFSRHTDGSRVLAFRAPSGWTKSEEDGLKFTGPDSSELHVFVQEVPDGVPLKGYVMATLQDLRDIPGGTDSIIVRRTEMSSLEAREIMFEMPDHKGVMTRRVIWCAVMGPRAFSFLFTAPADQVEKAEPFFKAVVQSAVIFRNSFEYTIFEADCKHAMKDRKPARIDEAQALAATLNGVDPAARAKAVAGLAAIFKSSPDSAIDLVLDRRPVVRASALDAISMSGNRSLVKFLARGVHDADVFVAERASRAIAKLPDAVALLREVTSDWEMIPYQELWTVTASLNRKDRLQIVSEILKLRAGAPARKSPSKPPGPPSGVKLPPPGKERAPGGVPGAVAEGFVIAEGFATSGPLISNKDLLAVSLLRDIPASEFAMPLDEIIAGDDQRVIAVALRIVLDRRERVSADALLKLVSYANEEVRMMAAANLGQSASPADVARIESILSKLSPKPGQPEELKEKERRLADELRVAIKKIRFRERVGSADQAARAGVIKEALADPQLADWVYREYMRDELEGPRPRNTGSSEASSGASSESSSEAGAAGAKNTAAPRGRSVSPLGENLFPANVTLYAAIPNPASALNKPGDSIKGIQMDSAEGQAHLALMFNSVRESLRALIGSPHGEPMLDYLGIDLNAPVAMASWTAEGAPRGLSEAQRKAVLVRVSDRDRFESLLGLYQARVGYFGNLTEYFSASARFIGLSPAILPLAITSSTEDTPKEKKAPRPSYKLARRDECNGYPVKVLERWEVGEHGQYKGDCIYLAYVGDSAVLAPDWHSLRDCLTRLDSGRGGLAGNPEFKRVASNGGDVIYMADIASLMISEVSGVPDGYSFTESGALNISKTAWETSHRLSFKEGGWSKSFLPFHPAEASAPRDLLPRSTIFYFLARLDAGAAWGDWGDLLLGADGVKQFAQAWSIDFEKEVLPEIGPECGAAVVGLPRPGREFWDAPWVLFFKLKGEKLGAAMRDGKLLKGVSGGAPIAPVKLGHFGMFVSVRDGYLIISGSEDGIKRLDMKEKLGGARDFVKAAGAAPPSVIAFGGYSLEGLIQGLGDYSNDPNKQQSIKSLTSIARAFHSQNFYAVAAPDGIDARMSVSLDREGRYSVSDLSSEDYRPTFAMVEARGVAITGQQHLKSLKLKIQAKGEGIIDRIKADIDSAHQSAEKRSGTELVVTVSARRDAPSRKVQVPVSDPALAPFLKPTREIRSDHESVKAKAREIAGDDRDAWSVAGKLADWTFNNLKWKRVDDADASETLATREADCLEFSQLYVAMARSLGLPARIVSGMAYNGGSFGAHAWVEVYAGEWVELDPTWGTHFVDATHVKGESNDLISYTALNAVDVEVMEVTRGVADFQRDADSLVGKLCEELPKHRSSALEVALDVAALADESMGAGAWDSMSVRERTPLSSAHRKLVSEISRAYGASEGFDRGMRVLSITRSGDNAEALVNASGSSTELAMKFKLTRRGEAWGISEIVYLDLDLHLVSESLQPSIRSILDQRQGKAPDKNYMTEYGRAVLLLDADDRAALDLSEKALKADPSSARFKYMKAIALLNLEKTDEAEKLLVELSDRQAPFAPAVFRLASHYHWAGDEELDEEKEQEYYEKAAGLFKRYAALAPADPRPHASLVEIYLAENDKALAEAAYKEVIKRDPRNVDTYVELADLLASLDRPSEALAVIDEGARHGKTSDELYAELFESLHISLDTYEMAERLASVQPERMEKNSRAALSLATMRIESGRAQEALPLLRKAVGIDPNNAEAHIRTASAYRELGNWRAALASADAALKIGADQGAAHYQRACALVRLGRKAEAMAALKRAVELGGYGSLMLTAEEDLKPLSGLPEFKKMVEELQKERK